MLFIKSYKENCCCLCGSKENLTGEHKIKASALRNIFGKDATLFIGSFNGIEKPRLAQSSKSKAFHFISRVCSLCNNSRTQAADQEFDKFHEIISTIITNNQDPSTAFNLPQYAVNSERYLNIFRYLAKILSCQIAESQGPRFLSICKFAINKSNQNMIYLSIDTDPFPNILNIKDFAHHGGLQVIFDKKLQYPTNISSSLTLGEVRYTFGIKPSPIIGLYLHLFDYKFWKKCQTSYKDALLEDNKTP